MYIITEEVHLPQAPHLCKQGQLFGDRTLPQNLALRGAGISKIVESWPVHPLYQEPRSNSLTIALYFVPLALTSEGPSQGPYFN